MKRSRVILNILLLIILLLLLGTSVQATDFGIYTQEDGCITRILPATTIADFKINSSVEEDAVVKDENGEVVEDNSIVKTGMTLEVGGEQYKLSVVGDVNGDGKITITDVVKCKLDSVNIKKLEGEQAKSADINGDGKKSITDLVQLSLVQVNIKDIKDYVKYTYSMPEEELNGMIQEKYTAEGDEDKDGLTNAEEEALGTDVYNVDTDFDGLTDYYEINISKTDPLKADTDGDGINDGDEIIMGLNPLAVDSKGDGVNDSQRTLTYKVQDEENGVDIDITGKGNIANTTVDTLDKPESEQSNELLDTIYNFHTKGTMENAVVTIKYSDEELEQKGLTEDDISLYYINEETSQLEKINSTVNKENKTITATLEHFSMYIIGKKEIANFNFNVKCDSWVDIDHDGIVDEIVIVNSGFDPKVNGFSFENFGSNKSAGGHCYGMATFAMAYYIDKLPIIGEPNKVWVLSEFDTWESNGYDLTNTYFENGGNLYDFKIESKPLTYILLHKLKDLMDYDEINDGYLKIKEEYYNELNKIGTIYKDVKAEGNGYSKYQYPLLNVESDELKNNTTNDENQMFNAIWNLFMLQVHDEYTSWGSNPDLAFKELQANLQNGVPVVVGTGNHAMNAISLVQDLKDPNKYKLAVYDNNYPGEIRYIDINRYKYNKFALDFTAWTNEYGYNCTYKGKKIDLSISYPKIPETNSVYVTLYDDGTLAFTSSDKEIEGKTVVEKYGDVSENNFLITAPWTKDSDKITNVDIVDKIQPRTTKWWFCKLTNLQTITNIHNLDTSRVTDMSSMFDRCSALTSLDVSGFDTSNVTNMNFLFSRCSALTNLDLSSFDTSNVTDMRSMFDGCSTLTSLDLSSFDTSNVTDVMNMFDGCSALTSLDVSGFDTSNVTNMYGMFANCSTLTSLDLSGFNTNKVTDMYKMFYGCYSLTSLDLRSFDTSNVTDMSSMFDACSALTSLDLRSFDISNVEDMEFMFSNCGNLTLIQVGLNWNTENAKKTGMFFICGTDHVTQV